MATEPSANGRASNDIVPKLKRVNKLPGSTDRTRVTLVVAQNLDLNLEAYALLKRELKTDVVARALAQYLISVGIEDPYEPPTIVFGKVNGQLTQPPVAEVARVNGRRIRGSKSLSPAR